MVYRHGYGDRGYSFSVLSCACAFSIAAGFLLCYQFALPSAVRIGHPPCVLFKLISSMLVP